MAGSSSCKLATRVGKHSLCAAGLDSLPAARAWPAAAGCTGCSRRVQLQAGLRCVRTPLDACVAHPRAFFFFFFFICTHLHQATPALIAVSLVTSSPLLTSSPHLLLLSPASPGEEALYDEELAEEEVALELAPVTAQLAFVADRCATPIGVFGCLACFYVQNAATWAAGGCEEQRSGAAAVVW